MTGDRKAKITREEAERTIADGRTRGDMWVYSVACITCTHWLRGDGEWGGDFHLVGFDAKVNSFGICTLNPKWEIAPATHFCGRHNGSNVRKLESVIYKVRQKDERMMRIELQKKNKTLKADLLAEKQLRRKP